MAHLPQKVGDPCYTVYTIQHTVCSIHYSAISLCFMALLKKLVIDLCRYMLTQGLFRKKKDGARTPLDVKREKDLKTKGCRERESEEVICLI